MPLEITRGDIRGDTGVTDLGPWLEVAEAMIRGQHPHRTTLMKITFVKITMEWLPAFNKWDVIAEYELEDGDAEKGLQQGIEQGTGGDEKEIRAEEGNVGLLREGEQVREERPKPDA